MQSQRGTRLRLTSPNTLETVSRREEFGHTVLLPIGKLAGHVGWGPSTQSARARAKFKDPLWISGLGVVTGLKASEHLGTP